MGTPLTVAYTSEIDGKYLELEELGEFMKELSFQAAEQEMQGWFLFSILHFWNYFMLFQQNMIVVSYIKSWVNYLLTKMCGSVSLQRVIGFQSAPSEG